MIIQMAFMAGLSGALAREDENVIDVHVSAGLVVPVEHTGTVSVAAVSMGTWVHDDLALRLRLLGSTPPVPDNSALSDALTWGMMVELQKSWGLNSRLDPFWTLSSGFIASDQAEVTSQNVAAFALHGGLGFAARLQSTEGPEGWTVSPVLGVAPRLLADDALVAFVGPTAEVRLGYAW